MSNTAALSIKIGASLAGGFKSAFASANAEVKKLKNQIGDVYKAQAERHAKAGKITMGDAAGFLGAAYAFAQPIKQAIQFETAMLGVAKQVEGARDSSGKLTPVYTGMRKEIQLLGREIPIATNELAAMVEAGARMGVAKEDLIGFTRNAAIMASAFDLPAAELADNMGKIANLYKIPIPAIGELGDTINYLDDKSIAKGGDIISFLTRVGGVAASVKITGGNMAALGSTLLSLGENTETASTATNAIFQKFAAAESGTKAFREAMGSLGLSLSDVQKGMQSDAQGTLLKVLDHINKMPKDQRLGILADLVGLEHSDTLAKLASGVEEYRKQIDLANSQDAKGSMGKEFQARLQTTEAQLGLMGNRVQEVGVAFGSAFLPALNETLVPLASVATWIGSMVEEFPVIASGVGVVAVVIGTYAAAVGSAAAAQWVLNTALAANPIGATIAVLAGAAIILYKNWEPVVAWFSEKFTWLWQAFDKIKSIGASIGDMFSMSANASMKPVGAAGGGLGSTGAGTGAGNTPTKAGFMGPVPAKPLPTMNLARAATAPQVTNVTNAPINVYQQPGENSQDLAKRVSAELARAQAADKRRALHD